MAIFFIVFLILSLLAVVGLSKLYLASDGYAQNYKKYLTLSVVALTLICFQLRDYLGLSIANKYSRQLLLTSATSTEIWIITTLSNISSLKPLQEICSIPNFKLVVVTNQNISNHSNKNIVILNQQAQSSLGYHILKHLPKDSTSIKMIGYLYAIQNHAEFIFEVEENDPSEFIGFSTSDTFRGLTFSRNDSGFLNPNFHFGQKSILNGTEMDAINEYIVCKMRVPLIQQKIGSSKESATENHTPALIFTSFTFASINFKNTLFLYDAFWALVLPNRILGLDTGNNLQVFWVQRILWEIGGHVGFYPTSIRDKSEMKFNSSENFENIKVEELILKLSTWKCSPSADLYLCMLQLTTLMSDWGFWSIQEIDLIDSWILDLKSLKYKQPTRLKEFLKLPCFKNATQTYSIFSPARENMEEDLNWRNKNLETFCNFTEPINTNPNRTDSIFYPNTLLIVEFNWPIYENIWLLDLIYKPHFPNILYCGDRNKESQIIELFSLPKFIESGVTSFSFVESKVDRGWLGYDCAIRAVEMGYRNLDGYLSVSDDVLFNFWNNVNYPKDVAWIAGENYAFKPQLINLAIPYKWEKGDSWHWSKTGIGENVTRQNLKEVYKLAKDDPDIAKWVERRRKYGFNESIAMCRGSDAFYFPVSGENMVYSVGAALNKRRMWLEIAVPTILSGISSPNETWIWPGLYLWNAERNEVFNLYNSSLGMIHAVKLSPIIKNEILRRDYCEHYIRKVFEISS